MMSTPDVLMTLKHEPDEVALGRREVAKRCAGHSKEFGATVTLLTSELITIALKQGRGEVVLTVTALPTGVRVNVIAQSGGREHCSSSPAACEAVSPGMLLVGALATSWGADQPHPGEWALWFELLETQALVAPQRAADRQSTRPATPLRQSA